MYISISYHDGFISNFECVFDDMSGHEYGSTGRTIFFHYVFQVGYGS